jgi:hypothetical protein
MCCAVRSYGDIITNAEVAQDVLSAIDEAAAMKFLTSDAARAKKTEPAPSVEPAVDTAALGAGDGGGSGGKELGVELPSFDELDARDVRSVPTLWWAVDSNLGVLPGGDAVVDALWEQGVGLDGLSITTAPLASGRGGSPGRRSSAAGGGDDDLHDVVVSLSKEADVTRRLIEDTPRLQTLSITRGPVNDLEAFRSALEMIAAPLSSRLGVTCSMVLFDAALGHVTRLVRILSLPEGHALLMGPHCSGKKTLMRLAAFLAGYLVVDVGSEMGVGAADVVRNVVLHAGLRDEPTLLLLSADDLQEADGRRAVSFLLNGGDLSHLVSFRDMSDIVSAFCSDDALEDVIESPGGGVTQASQSHRQSRVKVKCSSVTSVAGSIKEIPAWADTGDMSGLIPPLEGKAWSLDMPIWLARKVAWHVFCNTALRNIRVAVVMSFGPLAMDRAACNGLFDACPALLTKTHMNWVFEWSETALLSVATRVLSVPEFSSCIRVAAAITKGLEMTTVNDSQLSRLMARLRTSSAPRRNGASRSRPQARGRRVGSAGRQR